MRDWLTHRAAATPSAIAVDGDEASHTYADLDEAVDRVASRLATLGVDADDHLGLLVRDRLAMVRLYWAAMRLGCVAVPLAPAWGAESLRDRLAAADVTALVCGAETEAAAVAVAEVGRAGEGRVTDTSVPVVSVDTPQDDRVVGLSGQSMVSVAPVTWTGSDPMTLAFTAGATGEPKPVRLRLENHLASAVDAAFRFGVLPADRWLVTHPLHHVCGFAPVLRATLYGAALVLPGDDDSGTLADALTTHEATVLSASPTMLREMLDARGTLADSLRLALVAGAPAPTTLLERCRSYSVPASVTYTLTEAAGEVAAVDAADALDASGTLGRPMLRSSVAILDDDGSELPPGETGEIVVSGPSVTDGYYGDPPKRAGGAPEVSRGIATGDRGYRDESGRLWVLSRHADDIRVADERVRADDIAAVVREHTAVADAAVVGLPDDGRGETGGAVEADKASPSGRIGALVVPESDAPSVPALADHCRERLADFVAPTAFAFASALPRVASGAIDRDAVRNRLLDTLTSDSTALTAFTAVSASVGKSGGSDEGSAETSTEADHAGDTDTGGLHEE